MRVTFHINHQRKISFHHKKGFDIRLLCLCRLFLCIGQSKNTHNLLLLSFTPNHNLNNKKQTPHQQWLTTGHSIFTLLDTCCLGTSFGHPFSDFSTNSLPAGRICFSIAENRNKRMQKRRIRQDPVWIAQIQDINQSIQLYNTNDIKRHMIQDSLCATFILNNPSQQLEKEDRSFQMWARENGRLPGWLHLQARLKFLYTGTTSWDSQK